jgi:hypothetical protein
VSLTLGRLRARSIWESIIWEGGSIQAEHLGRRHLGRTRGRSLLLWDREERRLLPGQATLPERLECLSGVDGACNRTGNHVKDIILHQGACRGDLPL